MEISLPILKNLFTLSMGQKLKVSNNVRWKKYDQKLHREHKVADLASLPCCKQVFLYRTKRTNLTIQHMWRSSVQPVIEIPEIKDHGWFPNGKILCMDEAFPAEIDLK